MYFDSVYHNYCDAYLKTHGERMILRELLRGHAIGRCLQIPYGTNWTGIILNPSLDTGMPIRNQDPQCTEGIRRGLGVSAPCSGPSQRGREAHLDFCARGPNAACLHRGERFCRLLQQLRKANHLPRLLMTNRDCVFCVFSLRRHGLRHISCNKATFLTASPRQVAGRGTHLVESK